MTTDKIETWEELATATEPIIGTLHEMHHELSVLIDRTPDGQERASIRSAFYALSIATDELRRATTYPDFRPVFAFKAEAES